MTESRAEWAIRALTDPRTEAIAPDEDDTSYRTFEVPSLLGMLEQAVRSSMGRGSGAGGSEGSVLNYRAFTLRSAIEGQTRGWLVRHTRKPPPRVLRDALLDLGRSVDALHADSQIRSDDYERIIDQASRWCEHIRELLSPPTVSEITAPCPACGIRYIRNQDDERQAALITTSRPGSDARADCRHCHVEWVGEEQLLFLAAAVGVLPASA